MEAVTEVAPLLHRIPLMGGFVGAYALVDDDAVTLVDTDAELLASGRSSRGLGIRPGTEATIALPPGVTAAALAAPAPAEPFDVDEQLEAGSVPGVPDLEAIAAPGHCAGQMALLWRRHGGVLLCGDAAANFSGVDIPDVAEDFDAALDTARRLAELDFELAVFGHGSPLSERASAVCRETFRSRG
jgi:glyoxylase-like metal-dependent hydrolase (beta-lactamase superfamily II)